MNKNRLILLYSRLEPSGLSPIAPGTCGSLFALLLAPYLFLPLPLWARFIFLGVIFWSGTLAATAAEKILGKEDPGEVVIDELLGQWIACLPFATLNIEGYILPFLGFLILPNQSPLKWQKVCLRDSVLWLMMLWLVFSPPLSLASFIGSSLLAPYSA